MVLGFWENEGLWEKNPFLRIFLWHFCYTLNGDLSVILKKRKGITVWISDSYDCLGLFVFGCRENAVLCPN